MLKIILLLGMIVPLWANANISFTKQDLIGKWDCKVLEDEYFRATSDIEFRDDGIMTEHTTVYKWAESDEFYQIDTLKALSKWQVMGDKIRYYDNVVQSYAVDMPNYDAADLPNHKKDALLIFKAMMERSEVEQATSEDMISRIRFLDKDTYIAAFEGIDEDFPTDIENNHCKRKI